MSGRITARTLGQDRFEIEVRGHLLTVDQPVRDGGEDTAPTPTELFVASIGSCVAFYARRFLARHGIDADGLEVSCDYKMAAHPARVGEITIRIMPPAGLPDERRDAFLAVASHCTVHNTLAEPPSIRIALNNADEARAAHAC
jgi:putative redox protein